MGIASLVLGIVSVIIGFIPFCGTWAIFPAIVGLVLGIIDWVKKSKAGESKGKSIAGTILSIIAIVIIIYYWVVAAGAVKDTINNTDFNALLSDINYTVSE